MTRSILFAAVAAVSGEATKCSANERSIWIGSDSFAENYHSVSAKSLGRSDGTTIRLVEAYGNLGLSRDCASCLGDATQCGARNCMTQCLINTQSPACLECFGQHCMGSLLTCTGASSPAELPNQINPKPVTTKAPIPKTGQHYCSPSCQGFCVKMKDRESIRKTGNNYK